MRRNNFSSAADRRWQRRYERIQQRKEEEAERKDRVEFYAEMEKYSESLRQLELYSQAETLRQRELERALEEERRQRQEERERAMWADFNRWVEEHLRQVQTSSNRDYGYSTETLVVDEMMSEPEPEEELEVGDDSALDAFLGEFLTPGA